MAGEVTYCKPGHKAVAAWMRRRCGRWVVAEVLGYKPYRSGWSALQVRCMCECGTIAVVSTSNLLRGFTTQCWKCARKDAGERLKELRRKPAKPKYQELLRVVARRFGVSKQAVSALVIKRGWQGMLAFYEARVSTGV